MWSYIKVLKNYDVFKGRATRTEFWGSLLISWIVFVVLVAVEDACGCGEALAMLYFWAVIVPHFAAGVRRLHDTGYSGWFLFIPYYGLALTLWPGQRGKNRFGDDPRQSR